MNADQTRWLVEKDIMKQAWKVEKSILMNEVDRLRIELRLVKLENEDLKRLLPSRTVGIMER